MKKRFASFFLILSMLASLVSVPTVALAAADASADLTEAKITVTGNASTGYTMTIPFKNPTPYYVAVYSKKAVEGQEGEEVADDWVIQNINVMTLSKDNESATGIKDEDHAPVFFDRGQGEANTVKTIAIPGSKISPSLYNAAGDTYFILFTTDNATAANQWADKFVLDTTGAVDDGKTAVTVEPVSKVYDGTAMGTDMPAFVVKKPDGTTLTKDADYEITPPSGEVKDVKNGGYDYTITLKDPDTYKFVVNNAAAASTTVKFNITPAALSVGLTAGKTKNYNTVLTLADTDFTATGLKSGDTVAALFSSWGITSDGLAKTADVKAGGYDIKFASGNATKQTKGNYEITLNTTNKITVNPLATKLVATPKTGLIYTGNTFAGSALVDVKVQLADSSTDVPASAYTGTYTYDLGSDSEAKNAKTYNVTAKANAWTSTNYSKPSDASVVNVEIAKAVPTFVITGPSVKLGESKDLAADNIVVVKGVGTENDITSGFTLAFSNASAGTLSGSTFTAPATGTTATVKVNATNNTASNYTVPAEGTVNITLTALDPINGNAEITADPKDSIKVGESVTLTAKATLNPAVPGATTTYKWYKGNDVIADKTNATLTISNAQLTDSATYKCEITVEADGYTKKVFTPEKAITVSEATKLEIEASVKVDGPATVKENDNVTLTATPTITAPATGATSTYQWYKDGAILEGETNATLTIEGVKAEDNGTYECKVTVTSNDPAYVASKVVSDTYSMTVGAAPTPSPTPTAKPTNPPSTGGGGSGGSSMSIKFKNSTETGYVGDTLKLEPTIKGSTKTPTWKSADETIATVDENGVVTMLKEGTVKITAKIGSTTGTVTVKVLPAVASTPAPTVTPTQRPDTDSHKAYIYGYEDGDFRAERGITRAETAAIFARALTDYTEGEYENTMLDMDGTEWFANNVNYLVSQNVITGYEDGTFRPYENITRQEFATMIARLGEVLEAGDMPFSDVSAETEWGVDYIYTAYTNGWVSGYEDGTFRPYNSITRAEAVKIVNSYLKRAVDANGLDGVNYTIFPDVNTSHWAYFDIIEAANDHDYEKSTNPENWID